jgi:cardiolipin synthase
MRPRIVGCGGLTSRIVTIPNALTLIRLIAVPVFIYASFRGMFTLAFILFVSAALTDIFDGFIARWLNQRSRLGAVLDPAADKTMMASGYLFYTFSGNVGYHFPLWLTCLVFIRDLFISFIVYLLFTRVQVTRFAPSWAGKLSTLLQAIALGCVIAVNSWWPEATWLGTILFRAALVMTLFSSWDYMRRAQRLLDESGPSTLDPPAVAT